jgi:flagellum-specific ATP synthase
MNTALQSYREAVSRTHLTRRIGYLQRVSGLSLEVSGLDATVGELCRVFPRTQSSGRQLMPVLAEVVGVRPDHLALMPFSAVDGLAAGCEVIADGADSSIAVGEALLGRVIGAFGEPLDGRSVPQLHEHRSLRATPLNPLTRPRIDSVLETGVRCIDGLLTLGRGQRVGIFAGSGVGKSTLLGMIARFVRADVNVIVLVGERGREVKEFIDKHLGSDGLQRSVVIAAPSDQPALARLRAAYAGLAVAEYFRDQGKHVVLTIDSITRFAMARREVGLAAGEPPTARGYTPSVFAELPQLCERCGTSASGGSISALMTVLVEGDDFNEPISDNLRAILDGHIVLSRHLAHAGQYPAIDVLQSASRVMPDVVQPTQLALVRHAIRVLALLERNRQLVDIGAYTKGSNPELDKALTLQPHLQAWLGQSEAGASADEALKRLAEIFREVRA